MWWKLFSPVRTIGAGRWTTAVGEIGLIGECVIDMLMDGDKRGSTRLCAVGIATTTLDNEVGGNQDMRHRSHGRSWRVNAGGADTIVRKPIRSAEGLLVGIATAPGTGPRPCRTKQVKSPAQ